MKLLLIALFVSAFCFAQDAKIIFVPEAEAKKLADAYKTMQAAQERFEALKQAFAVKNKWTQTLSFSPDFKAAVPEQLHFFTSGASLLNCGGTWTPAAAGSVDVGISRQE
jgi:hypothetical protein